MKKFYLIAAMAVSVLVANAQAALRLSTYQGTNLQKFDGKQCNITVDRYVFTGWNTISLPFALTEDEVNEAFGSDCTLEKLVGAESCGNSVVLNFQDCKEQGIEANTPYILHYKGNSTSIKIKKAARITDNESNLTYFIKGMAETVTMVGTQTATSGKSMYGVLVRDNAEAKFVKVDSDKSNVYATRCYIETSSSTPLTFITNHLGRGEVTSISNVVKGNEKVDVYNLSGVRVSSKATADAVNQLPAGVYVVKGQKVIVK